MLHDTHVIHLPSKRISDASDARNFESASTFLYVCVCVWEVWKKKGGGEGVDLVENTIGTTKGRKFLWRGRRKWWERCWLEGWDRRDEKHRQKWHQQVPEEGKFREAHGNCGRGSREMFCNSPEAFADWLFRRVDSLLAFRASHPLLPSRF